MHISNSNEQDRAHLVLLKRRDYIKSSRERRPVSHGNPNPRNLASHFLEEGASR